MARTKQTSNPPKPKWVQQRYLDHASQPAEFVASRPTNPEASQELAPLPPFSFQIYSTIPLDLDHTALCRYLSREIDFWPMPSFEIYAPQPDVFACVEHQRREIAHRKASANEELFPGIAKVVSNEWDQLLQGFLLVITSHSYRRGFSRNPQYEEGTGPLWVDFNRRFPQKASVDVRSRYVTAPLDAGPLVDDESEIFPEANEISVLRCQNIFQMRSDLKAAFLRSLQDDETYNYGLDEDEGQPLSFDEQLSPEFEGALNDQAATLSLEDFSMVPRSEEAITIASSPVVPEPDIRYVIYVPFPHHSLAQVARAFTSALVSNIPAGKSIHLEFYKPPNTTISSIITSHRGLIGSRPDIALGALHTITSSPNNIPREMRVYPTTRDENQLFDIEREPYKTFAVILDRPDFITEPGVLFLLADGGQMKEEFIEMLYPGKDVHVDFYEYHVWRSVGMPEVARRLAMLALEEREREQD